MVPAPGRDALVPAAPAAELARGRTEGSAHMSEAPRGGKDSRLDKDLRAHGRTQPADRPPVPDGMDTYSLYRRGLDLLGRGSAAAAAQLLERAAAAEPGSRSVLEALARAQFDAGRYAEAAGSFRQIVEASPSEDYAP